MPSPVTAPSPGCRRRSAPTATAAPAPPTIKAGVEKWRAGDYPAAVAIWQPFAEAGDPDALFNLGQAYKLGRGVAADPATARDYYRKAAAKGHLPAQANLGIALFQAGEKPEAIKWLKTAADRGEARAQYVLGIAAFNGDGVPRSQPLGYGYLLRAQASGLPQAVTALGTIAPGLSPGDRSAGEAIAASLAAGAGVPPALAVASAPRMITGSSASRSVALPVVTPPPAAASAPDAGTANPLSPAVAANPKNAPATRTAAADKPALPPVPRPAPAVPVPQPTPAQADAAASRDPLAQPPGRDAVAATPGRSPPTVRSAERGIVPLGSQSGPPVALREPSPARADASAAAPPRSVVATVDLPPSRPTAPEPQRPTVDEGRPARSLKPFETAVEAAKKPDGWRVQLGAFSSRKLADAAWADIRATAAPAKPVFATDGAVTKLQMGPFATRDAAKAACTKLTAAGRACFVTQG